MPVQKGFVWATLLLMSLSLAPGCSLFRGKGKSSGTVEPLGRDNDIYRVVLFWPQNNWRSFDSEGDLNPEGFAFVMYLISQETDRGVFADGTMFIKLFVVDISPDGQRKRTLVGDWSQPMAEVPRRSKGMLGYGYQPTVNWGDLDLLGKDIQIVVQYQTPSGRKVSAETHEAKVPAHRV